MPKGTKGSANATSKSKAKVAQPSELRSCGVRPTNWKPRQPEVVIRKVGTVPERPPEVQGRREGFTGKGRRGKKRVKGGSAARLERVKEAGRLGGNKTLVKSDMGAGPSTVDDDLEPKRQRHRELTMSEKYFVAHHGAPPKTSDQV